MAAMPVQRQYLATEEQLINDYHPISRLPSEVLLKIFEDVMHVEHSFCTPTILPFQDIYGPAWFPVTSYRTIEQVCHQWRVTILGCPMIWARKIEDSTHYRPIPGIKWLSELYRRSEPVPCHFTMCEDYELIYPSTTHFAQQYLHRIGSIYTRVFDKAKFQEHYTSIISMAPVLTSLIIDAEPNEAIGIEFPGYLHESCRLEQLSISAVSFKLRILDSQCYTHLRSLRVDFMENERMRFSTRQWCQILRNLPLLEVLGITLGITPLPETGATEDVEPVELPHLRELCLFNYSSFMSLFIPILSFPVARSPILDLHFREIESDDELTTIVTFIQSYLASWSQSIDFPSSWYLRLEQYVIVIADLEPPTSKTDTEQRPFHCHFQFAPDMPTARLAQHLIPLLQFIVTRTLTLNFKTDNCTLMNFPAEGWPPLLAAMERWMVEHLAHVQELVDAFNGDFPFDLCMADEKDVALPNLDKMTFSRSTSKLPELYLLWRHHVGRPIQNIVFTRRTIRDKAVENRLLKLLPGIMITYGIPSASQSFD